MDESRRKYRPANGTEGMSFMEEFCERCIHEKWTHTEKHGDAKCEILDDGLMYDTEDENFPVEWQYDENDKPTCTAWVKFDWDKDPDDDNGGLIDPPPPPVDDPNQLVMPFLLDEILEQHTEPIAELETTP